MSLKKFGVQTSEMKRESAFDYYSLICWPSHWNRLVFKFELIGDCNL